MSTDPEDEFMKENDSFGNAVALRTGSTFELEVWRGGAWWPACLLIRYPPGERREYERLCLQLILGSETLKVGQKVEIYRLNAPCGYYHVAVYRFRGAPNLGPDVSQESAMVAHINAMEWEQDRFAYLYEATPRQQLVNALREEVADATSCASIRDDQRALRCVTQARETLARLADLLGEGNG